jgi:hypothetical protein
MYGEPALKVPALWQRMGEVLRCSLVSPVGVRLETTVSIDHDGVSIRHRLENLTDVDYEEVQSPTCIKLYRPFNDVFLERTYVHHADGLDLLASETPERLRMNAEEWLPVRYVARCAPPAVSPAQRRERLTDRIVRYTKVKLVDVPFIATTSSPPGWIAASHTLATSSLFMNPARTCHHVDPSAALKPRGTALLALKLYVVRGSIDDAWRLVHENHAQGKL